MTDHQFMEQALSAAREAGERDEVPIGAVIVHEGEILSMQGNRTRELHDPTAHAEILAIREACQKLGVQRIPECDLYVTLEPCAMCAAAIAFARIRKLVIGAKDEKGGGVVNGVRFFEADTCHHKKIEILSGVCESESAELLKNFFAAKR